MKTISRLLVALGVLMGSMGFAANAQSSAPAPGSKSGGIYNGAPGNSNAKPGTPGYYCNDPGHYGTPPGGHPGSHWGHVPPPPPRFELCRCGKYHNHPIDVKCNCVHRHHQQKAHR